jgi:glyoxylase-like metal-dependent hydrolase (beta-lactamase superfamily II)
MKVFAIKGINNVYSSNVYLITGDWKKLDDVNTLIDVGSDPSIVDALERINTGVGKNKVDQVILTHSHSDHTAILPLIREKYQPRIYACSPHLEGVGHMLSDGDKIPIGDRIFEVIHAPGHSSDSIALFNDEEGVLFIGDTPVMIKTPNGNYEDGFVRALKTLCKRCVRSIYFGHGEPITKNAHTILLNSLSNVHKSKMARALDMLRLEEEMR